MPETAFLITAFATLFVVIDPPGLVPLFIALTRGMGAEKRRAMARRACLIAASLLLLFGLAGETIFYAGPTPPAAGRPLGSVGPTTASRMDFATPELMDAGLAACIGKGKRSQAVIDACVRNRCVYFAAVGGIAALLAKHVTESETVAWDDLGTEALRRIELIDFPVFVAVDSQGGDLYRAIESGEQL